MAADGKIQTLNNAIRDAIPLMRKAADENPNASVLVRAVTFSSGARWHIAQAVLVDQFTWSDMVADGVTDLGHALKLVADQLKVPPMESRALPPVLVLLSDGGATDNWRAGVRNILDLPWGKKAVRIAIGIGQDVDEEALAEFVANPEIKVLRAGNPDALIRYIKWVSTAVVKSASSPPSQAHDPSGKTPGGNVPIPAAPADPDPSSSQDVW